MPRHEEQSMSASEPPIQADIAAVQAMRCSGILNSPLAPGLYLVATPIGNLGDITMRALSRSRPRRHRPVRGHTPQPHAALAFRHPTPTRAYHEHNAARERPRVLAELEAGGRIALISDAGTPLISDPGWKLVRDAIDAGHQVEALPGASAALAALWRRRPADGCLLLCRLSAAQERGAAHAHCGAEGRARDARLFRGALARRRDARRPRRRARRPAGRPRARADQAARGGAPGPAQGAGQPGRQRDDQGRGRDCRRAAAASGGHRCRHRCPARRRRCKR